MGVDRVGLALPAAGLAVGLLALDDGQAGGPGAWSTIQASNSGFAGVVIADLSCPDRSAGRERELHLVRVAVGVDTNDGVDEFCQHGHRPVSFL
jgi:hypothetical protein